MKALFEGLGWKVRLQQKRSQYFLTMVKEVALGSGLKKEDPSFYLSGRVWKTQGSVGLFRR